MNCLKFLRLPVMGLLVIALFALVNVVTCWPNRSFVNRKPNASDIFGRSHHLTIDISDGKNKTKRKMECPSSIRGPFRHGFTNENFGRKIDMTCLFRRLSDVKAGGWWEPDDCEPVQEPVAVIVPFRGRRLHLRTYIPYIHLLLQQQRVPHLIITVTQTDEEEFNKGLLFNMGVLNTPKWINCFILADIDILPDRLENTFNCSHEFPKALVTGISRSNYIPLEVFGGIVALTREQYYRVNGFGTFFWGWGEEDNDFYRRCIYFYNRVDRVDYDVGLVTHLSHTREESAKADALRILSIRPVKYDFSKDGLTNTSELCKVNKIELLQLRTAISVKCVRPDESEIEKLLNVKLKHSNTSDYIDAD